MNPTEKAYWDRSAKEVAKELPGERLVTPAGIYIVSTTEAFKTLTRKAMASDFENADREPGDLYVTNARGAPLINITNTVDGDPQVVWLKSMLDEGKEVSGSALARAIAEEQGETKKKSFKLLDFCMKELDGKNVLEAGSPIRVVQNTELPFDERNISFNAKGGTAKNSVGVASLTDDVNGIKTIDQAKEILKIEAERLEVDLATLLDPNKIKGFLKKSPLLRKVIRFFEA